jgi:ADP-ribosylation factor-like protein 13B
MEESARLKKIRENTYTYLVRDVDPIIAKCITHLLLTKPESNLPSAMLAYLQGDTEIPESAMSAGHGLVTKREQRMYLATKISPVLTKLMTGLAQLQPENVVEYLINELTRMIENNECAEMDAPEASNVDNMPKPNKENRRPLTSKGKLGDALEYEKSRISTTDAERPGTAPQQTSSTQDLTVPSSGAKKTQVIVGGDETPALSGSASGVAEVETITTPPLEPPLPIKSIQIAMLGVGGAGKTSIISSLQGVTGASAKPTLGFRPTTMMLDEQTKIKFYDLGGGKKIRDIWTEYYHDVHAVIYVIDATTAMDSPEWVEMKEVFDHASSNLLLAGKPFLVIANKADVEGAHDHNAICEYLAFPTSRTNNIISCTAKGVVSASPKSTAEDPNAEVEDSGVTDPRLEQGIEWLLTVVNSHFEVLDSRVTADTKTKAVAEAKKRLARERKVLRNKITSAFFDKVAPELRPDGVEPATTEEIYDVDEGIAFLADEIGLTKDTIGEEAMEIAHLIGFQRLALQMVGALFAPISKKKVPMTWAEIKELVCELRGELGL